MSEREEALKAEIAHYRKVLMAIDEDGCPICSNAAKRALDKYPEARRLNPPIYPYEPNSLLK